MHELLQFSDLDWAPVKSNWDTIGRAYRIENAYFESGFLKFESCTLAEVYGFILANTIGLKTPRFKGFRCTSHGNFDGNTFGANRIGLITDEVKSHPNHPKSSISQVAKVDPLQAARALLVGFFGIEDGFEVLRDRNGESFFIDLDLKSLFRIHPENPIDPFPIDVTQQFENLVNSFYALSCELKISDLLLEVTSVFTKQAVPDLRISGHPQEFVLNEFARSRIECMFRALEMWVASRT